VTENGSFDAANWQGRQANVISDIFDGALEELEIAGLRIRAGSSSPRKEQLTSAVKIAISPLRFDNNNAMDSLSLSLTATAANGPCRYVSALRASGEILDQSITRLVLKSPDIWQKHYLSVGLWIGDGEHTARLTDIEQIRKRESLNICLSGVTLHSSSRNNVQAGLMFMAVIYRSVLDEVSDASKMGRLSALVLSQLSGQGASYERLFRP
jgi:hypothetical protein